MANIPGLLDKYKKIDGERFFHDIFVNEEYRAVKPLKADVVIDVGALAGEFSAYVYDQAKMIYALEPYSKYYQELEQNIKEFNLNKIKSFKLALAGKNGKRHLGADGARGGNHLQDEGGEEVEAKTLATFMKEQGIEQVDVLKIDVENAEVEIFAAADFGEVLPKINCIIGEHLSGEADHIFQMSGMVKTTDENNTMYLRK